MKPTYEELKQRLKEAELKITQDNLERRLKECTSELLEKNELLKNPMLAEEALRQSESKYSSLFENMIDGVAVYEPVNNGEDFVFIDLNKAAEKISATAKEVLIGKSVSKMFPGVKEFGLFDVFQRVWRSGKAERHPMAMYKDDRISHSSENSVYKLPSGEIVAIYSDETQRKQAEEALRWESVVSSTITSIFEPLISPWVSIKDVAETILDRAITLTGSKHGYVSSIDPKTGDNVGYVLAESVRDWCDVSKENRRIFFSRGKDGLYPGLWGHSLNTLEGFFTNSPQPHEASSGISEGRISIRRFLSVPVMLGNELVGQITLTNKDQDYTKRDLSAISRLAESYALAIQRRRFEEALQEANDKLERRVEERTAELLKSNKDLKREITERKRVENALEESELWMRNIFNSLEEAVFVVTPDRKLVNVNEAAQKMFGFTRYELENQSTEVLHVNSEYYVEFGKRIKEAFARGESANFEFKAKRKSGDIFPTEHTVSLLKDDVGRPIGIVSVVRDVTERKKSEKALWENEEKFRGIFSGSPIGIKIYNSNGQMLNANKAFLEIFGLSELGKLKDIELFDEPFMSDDAIEKLHNNKSVRYEYSLDFNKLNQLQLYEVSRTGSIHLDILITPLTHKNKMSFRGYLVQVQDISARKQAERHIHALTQELIKAQESERQKIARDLHDNVAQNLSTLRIGFETLFDDEPSVPAEIKEKVTGLSKTLLETITSVRDLAYDLRPPTLDQFGLVHTVFQYCEDVSEVYGLDVNFSSAGLDGIELDFETEINLYRIIQEALNNARKHADASHISVRLVASFPNIILRIEDNGKGFDTQKCLDTAVRKKRMGLRSMNERVALLQGLIRLHARPNEGTKILIEIPYKEKNNG